MFRIPASVLLFFALLFFAAGLFPGFVCAQSQPIKVFIFAGQSNMEGADSRIGDAGNFPPYVGIEKPREDVRYSYVLGRENPKRSDGWVPLQSVNDWVGPELTFARQITQTLDGPIAVIKCAAGGTHLGGDWNPDEPSGFKMYPRALELVRTSLQQLKSAGHDYQIEGFFWHQGENDMFNEEYQTNYGRNLKNFLKSWRRDLNEPRLKFFIGELCTKTIWGMDLRPRMYAISLGQKQVTEADPRATYVPTAHIGVEIGGGVGLHYHYGTLGQLQHGENYAEAYLKSIGKLDKPRRVLEKWPYARGETVDLVVLAGHRNMEGERAFTQELKELPGKAGLLLPDQTVAFKYSLGGGFRTSEGWEPLGPVDYYQTFGPELSLADYLKRQGRSRFAIAKFTHSGSQIIDWTPEGSMAKSRMLYKSFLAFIRESIQEIESRGNRVRLDSIVYHVGENDMSFFPYRQDAPQRIQSLISQSRIDLKMPNLSWIVSQQPPTDDERVNRIDVLKNVGEMLSADPKSVHLKIVDLPAQKKKLVIDTPGIVFLGEKMAQAILGQDR